MRIQVCDQASAGGLEEHLLKIIQQSDIGEGVLSVLTACQPVTRHIDTDPFAQGRRIYLLALEDDILSGAAQLDIRDGCGRLALLPKVTPDLESCVETDMYVLILCAALEYMAARCPTSAILEAPVQNCCIHGRCTKLLSRSGIMRRVWPIENARRLYGGKAMAELEVGQKALHNFKLVAAIHGDVLSGSV